ncbi:hypothetical protein [Geomesophilobacter sediminis]|uniref:Uncharacterized protein n=1 Tax=Geomesophilobacter sediminis TaxID=2798584 RepID=A0A8J7M3E0_9BACT|nr:hypothetical protein [Geomesophilobacter sediminis]MBJ6728029.1 hypothetical protein [Geomesophilobacter sediminis]
MLSKTFRVLIHADPETLWSVLIDRTKNPGRYQVGITETRISSPGQHSFIRESIVHGQSVKERITTDAHNGEVSELILSHPSFTGALRWKVVPTARQSPVAPVYLECHAELVPIDLVISGVLRGEAESSIDIERELDTIREAAEAKARIPLGGDNRYNPPEPPRRSEVARGNR